MTMAGWMKETVEMEYTTTTTVMDTTIAPGKEAKKLTLTTRSIQKKDISSTDLDWFGQSINLRKRKRDQPSSSIYDDFEEMGPNYLFIGNVSLNGPERNPVAVAKKARKCNGNGSD